MPASKIVDEQEVIRWFEEGRTYAWMVREYDRKYHLKVWPTMFSNFRARRGLDNRVHLTKMDLAPWRVKPEHRWRYPLMMLRLESRRRAGVTIPKDQEPRLDSWLARLREEGVVVHYDADTDEGFFYVPRREGIDLDLIREPRRGNRP